MSLEITARVSIVTVTYNAASFIDQFMISICELLAACPNFTLVVVDNASEDTTLTQIRRQAVDAGVESRVRLVAERVNLGFGKGCNLGVKESKIWEPEYVWLLNPDTRIDKEAAIALLECFKNYPNSQFVGSALKNELGESRSGAFRFPTAWTVFLSNARFGLLDKLFSSHTNTAPLQELPFYTDWLTGASFMAKLEAFENLGGFDPAYFLYFEEVDFFLRAARASYKTLFCPKSIVFHESGASTGMNKKNLRELKPRPKYWFESRRYYYLKNYGRAYFLLVDWCFLSGQVVNKIKCFAKGESPSNPPRLIQSVFRHSALF